MLIERKQYELPSEEQHSLKIIEIGELKKVQTKFGMKDKFTIKIEVIDQTASESDEPIYVFSTFAPSLGEKSNLCKFIRQLGYKVDPSVPFETDDLLGVKFTAYIKHSEGTNGNTYANVVADTVKPLKSGPVKPASKPTAKPAEDIEF